LSQLVYFYEIQEGGYVIEGDPSDVFSNLAASTIPKWWTLIFLRRIKSLQPTSQNGRVKYCMLTKFQIINNFSKTIFVGRLLQFEVRVLFYVGKS
jgi:hypothetical protein